MAKKRKVYRVGKNGKTKIVSKKNELNKQAKLNANKSKSNSVVNEQQKVKTNVAQAETAAVKASFFAKVFSKKWLPVIIIFSLLFVFSVVTITVIAVKNRDPRRETLEVPYGITFNDGILSWNEVESAHYYVLKINGQDEHSYENTYDVSSLLPNVYEVQIRAVKNFNAKSDYSESYYFEIEKPIIMVSAIDSIIISKIYDASDVCNQELTLGKHYELDKSSLKYGQEVDITVTDIKFNSCNVAEVNCVEVSYSADLTGKHSKYYQIVPGVFTLNAEILPKQIEIVPTEFAKQFADNDNLSDIVVDGELNQSISINYIRQSGESVGYYNIVGVETANHNYAVQIQENSGINKFEILPRLVNIYGSENAFFKKVYDGTAEVDLSELNSSLYTIENVVDGYNVDIWITRATFNSVNVVDADTLTVLYSGTLIDPNNSYKTIKSSFTISGEITPKKIQVIPNSFNKEFGDEEDLSQEYIDTELKQTIKLSFIRSEGENVGVYDILSIESSSTNYAFDLVQDSGIAKFEILQREIKIYGVENAFISKDYDGTEDFDITKLNTEIYKIENTLAEYEVDIVITQAKFNSSNVTETYTLTVYYSGLNDLNGVYRTNGSSFTISGRIKPKKVEVIPNNFNKEFGDEEDLSQEYKDTELKQTIKLSFTRTEGEKVGVYDILNIESSSSNYAFDLVRDSGKGKFEILQREIKIYGAENALISKDYDGTENFDITKLNNEIYKIENTLAEYEVDIVITQAKFNSSNVTETYTLTVYYSGLNDPNGVYRTSGSSFTISGKIKPKKIQVIPNSFSKEFGNSEDLSQQYIDTELNQTIKLSFTRTKGEKVGVYDILSIESSSSNYAFDLVRDSGKGKFEILQREIKIYGADNALISKSYDGSKAFDIAKLNSKIYIIENALAGYEVGINITQATFNSPNVTEADSLTVYYNGLYNPKGIYKTSGSSFTIGGQITPKTVKVIPNNFSKEFGDEEDLSQEYIDTELKQTIKLSFIRSEGENVGVYDILSIESSSTNYAFDLVRDSGIAKFEILQREIKIYGAENALISKDYDGTEAFDIAKLNYEIYKIENTLAEYEVDINITRATFNSSNVTEADSLTVYYSGLNDPNDVYRTNGSSFTISGRIKPKKVEVIPNNFNKEFGNSEDLSQQYIDTELNHTIKLNFVRSEGQGIGFYDILSIKSSSSNYAFDLVRDSGKGKFEILQREIKIYGAENALISKDYDGTENFDITKLNTEIYKIENTLAEYEVSLIFSQAKFNSKDVTDAKTLTVNYSGLNDPNGVYRTSGSSFTISGKIKPKKVEVIPNNFKKEFGDDEDLSQQYLDTELNETIDIKFERADDEKIGKYDIVTVKCLNTNYKFSLVKDSGKGKFEILQREIKIYGADNALISKSYDGSKAFDIAKLNSKIYIIENALAGYEVGINITQATFNSPNVTEADSLTVYYDGLYNPKGIYKTSGSSFTIGGQITPKTVKVIPNSFSKEFGNSEDLSQDYKDTELKQTIKLSFTRTEGESVGNYDIVSVSSPSTNYDFRLADGSGKNKFKIDKRTLTLTTTDKIVSKTYDGSLAFNGEIKKDIHYILNGELDGYYVDIIPVSALFNSTNVNDASQVVVGLSHELNDANGIYKISMFEFVINAKIRQKQIEIEPNSYEKQYGDSDDLTAAYFDKETDSNISLTFSRTAGEKVGKYDLTTVTCDNSNYDFHIVNATKKFTIKKRVITISPTDKVVSKIFDNSSDCDIDIKKGANYVLNNVLAGEETDINFSKRFNSKEVIAKNVILSDFTLKAFDDRYELSTKSVALPAKITPKQVTIEPHYYSVQYGDVDYLRQQYTDDVLGLTFNITFIRDAGEEVGHYDIHSAVSDNRNYEFNVSNGEEKYQISPRVLGIEKIGNPTFNKIYDGTTECILPITQGVHYNLTNLVGGSNVTLSIISQEYNSKNVKEATKVIVKYTAILDGEEGDQFITAGGTMEFDAVIKPHTIAVTPNLFVKDYLAELPLEQEIEDTISGEIIPISFVSTAGVDHILTDCGTYDITDIKYTDTNHIFLLEGNTGKEKFVINRINIVINANNRNTVYNTSSQAINAPYSVPAKTLQVMYKLSTAADDAFSANLPVNAETYTARVIFEGDRNYLPQYVDRKLNIERADSVITNTTPVDYIYDGNVKPITATLNHSEANLVYSRNDYINAGTYNFIMISVPQSQNYKAASITVSLTIAKLVVKNSDITYPISSAITYGQHLYSSILSGGSEMGTFDWVEPETLPVVANTKFLVEFTPSDKINYDWSNVDVQRYVNIKVNKFKVTEITFPTASGVVYTSSLSTSVLTGTSEYGTFDWQNRTYVPKSSGYYNMVFKPYDEANYDFTSITKIEQVYVEVSYRTFFEVNGGNEIASMVVKTITEVPYVYREGYKFEGWFTDELLTHKAEFPMQITKDTTLYAGWYSEGLIFLKRDGYYSVKLDSSTIESSVFIPSEYKGLPVKSIENEGFKNCTALELVVIPETVVSIGHYAFDGCTNLAFVQIKNSYLNINFGKGWIDSGFEGGTDVYFDATPCPDCDGTEDFHQPSCEYYTE